MIDVLRIIARLNVGGPARHVLRIDAPLRRRGWRTLLVTGRAESCEGELLDEARALGVDVHVLPDLGRAIHPLRDLRVLRQLRRLVAEHRPSIVHTHTAKAGLLGRLAAGGPTGGPDASGARRPALVHTYHGHVLSGYFAAPVAAAFRLSERRLAARTDRLIAVAGEIRDELLTEHRVGRAEQYVVVPPGIDRLRTAPDATAGAALRAGLGWSSGHVVVGCVGRLAPVKRVELLLAAWPEVVARAPAARLLVVGDGPCGEAVRARVAALPGAAWLPPRAELGAVYGALDVVALSSAHEGLPQVIVEALQSGLPVVATAVGGVPSLLVHGASGLLVPSGDARALAAALGAVCADDALRAQLSAGARATDLSRHDAEAVAAALAALYAELRPVRLENPAGETQTRAACISSS